MRQLQKMGIVRILLPITLEGPEVIGISQMLPQILKYLPIPVRPPSSDLPIQKCRNVFGDPIVIQQRVVDIEQKNCSSPSCLLCFDAMPIPSRPPFGNPFLSCTRNSRGNDALSFFCTPAFRNRALTSPHTLAGWPFEFGICFEFRISSFEFPVSPIVTRL